MSGHHPFTQLTKGFSPERRERIDAMKAALLAEMRREPSRPDAGAEGPGGAEADG